MPGISLTEYGKLASLGLIRHYQQKQSWYIEQGKLLVAAARFGVAATKTAPGAAHVFSQDEVGQMLRLWLVVNSQWQALLKSKPHLPINQYDTLTDAMAGTSPTTRIFRLPHNLGSGPELYFSRA